MAADEGSFEHLAAGLATVRIPELGRTVDVLSDIRALARVAAAVFRFRPDVVHTHTAKAGALGRIAALVYNATRSRRRRAIVVHTFHGNVLSGYFSPFASWSIGSAERMLARITDPLVTISPSQRRDITSHFRIAPEERTVIIPLGLDLAALFDIDRGSPNLRAELGIPADGVVVGYVGRLVPIKDVGTLLEAFAAAAGVCPRLWLVIAGDGPQRQGLESSARRLGVSARVRFVGWREDIAALHATFDILALSSLNEGTPVAVIEAMAAARVVVATAVGGVADVVEHDRTGVLVPVENAQAMATAIVDLARDEGRRMALGAAGRAAAHRFSAERLTRDIDRLYRDTLASKRAP